MPQILDERDVSYRHQGLAGDRDVDWEDGHCDFV